MPIIGLTDQGGAFPQIGTLRKGDPKPQAGDKPGKNLDYFRFVTRDGITFKKFTEVYGERPQKINVYLPYPGVDQNFQAWREEWSGSSLVHRCDGETVVFRRVGSAYSSERIPCAERSKRNKDRACKPAGRLAVIIPELGRLAYVQVLTGSIWDILEIHKNLQAAAALRGDLRGIPFILSRVPREISKPGKEDRRFRQVEWLINIEPAPEWVGYQIATMKAAALPGTSALPALPAPTVSGVDLVTGEIMDGEYIDAPDVEPESDLEPEPEPTAISAELQAKLDKLNELGWDYYGDIWSNVTVLTVLEHYGRKSLADMSDADLDDATRIVSGKIAKRNEQAEIARNGGPAWKKPQAQGAQKTSGPTTAGDAAAKVLQNLAAGNPNSVHADKDVSLIPGEAPLS